MSGNRCWHPSPTGHVEVTDCTATPMRVWRVPNGLADHLYADCIAILRHRHQPAQLPGPGGMVCPLGGSLCGACEKRWHRAHKAAILAAKAGVP